MRLAFSAPLRSGTFVLTTCAFIAAASAAFAACGTSVDSTDEFGGATSAQTSGTTSGSTSTSASTGAGGAGGNVSSTGNGGAGGTASSTDTSASTGAGGSGGGSDKCATICATEATLMCPSSALASCIAYCKAVATDVTWCTTIAAMDVDCLLAQPASSFTCDATGKIAVKPGICSSEIDAIATCLYDGPPGGLPDLGPACSSACAAQASLACANPTCDTDCNNALKPGATCAGALGALVACAAKQVAASYTCSAANPPKPTLSAGHCDFEEAVYVACLEQP